MIQKEQENASIIRMQQFERLQESDTLIVHIGQLNRVNELSVECTGEQRFGQFTKEEFQEVRSDVHILLGEHFIGSMLLSIVLMSKFL